MTNSAATLANDTAVPKAHQVLTDEQWSALHDLLMLSLDALGNKPSDFTPDFLANCVFNLRPALKLLHKHMEM